MDFRVVKACSRGPIICACRIGGIVPQVMAIDKCMLNFVQSISMTSTADVSLHHLHTVLRCHRDKTHKRTLGDFFLWRVADSPHWDVPLSGSASHIEILIQGHDAR